MTLGHEIKDKNARHKYFGSNLVIDDLKRAKGWSEGFINLNMD